MTSSLECMRCHSTFVRIVPDLELCDCTSRGRLSYERDAEADARVLVNRSGGLNVIRERIEKARQARLARQRADERPVGRV